MRILLLFPTETKVLKIRELTFRLFLKSFHIAHYYRSEIYEKSTILKYVEKMTLKEKYLLIRACHIINYYIIKLHRTHIHMHVCR